LCCISGREVNHSLIKTPSEKNSSGIGFWSSSV
jgi:hypothetical protein